MEVSSAASSTPKVWGKVAPRLTRLEEAGAVSLEMLKFLATAALIGITGLLLLLLE